MSVELPKGNSIVELRAFALQMAVKSTGWSMYSPGDVIQTAMLYTYFLSYGQLLEEPK